MLAQTLVSGTMVRQDALAGFRNHLALQGKSDNTVEAYAGDLGVYAAWAAARYGEQFDMAMLNRSDLQLFYQQQIGQAKVSPATWNRRRASLRVFAQWAQGQGLISYDPTDGIQAAAEVELAPRWIDGREMGRLERAMEQGIQGATSAAWKVKGIRDRAVVLLMAEGGLREGEVSALDLGDVALGERKAKISIRFGKGRKTRVVPVGKATADALRAWVEARGGQDGAFFTGKGGSRLEARGIQRLVVALGQKGGVADLTPHRLRHYFVKSRVDGGASLIEVAKLTGHGRLETLARYGQPSEADLERVQGIR